MFPWLSLRWLHLLTVPFCVETNLEEIFIPFFFYPVGFYPVFLSNFLSNFFIQFFIQFYPVGLTLAVQSSPLALFYILPAHPTDFNPWLCDTFHCFCALCFLLRTYILLLSRFKSHSTSFHASPQAGHQTPGRWYWGFWWRMDTTASRWGARRM